MQRALSLEDTPALAVPLRFLLCAPWFGLAAGVLLLWQGDAALQTRWSPVTLALTHLLTLGFLAMTMMGAVLQLLPVVAGSTVSRAPLVAHACWAGLGAGTVLLATAFLSGVTPLYGAAAVCLGLSLLGFAVAVGLALARRTSAGALPVVAGMRLAVAALALTGLLGLALAAHFGGVLSLPALLVTDVHAAWGLLGWVAVLVLAVAFQVIPMFQATPTYPKPVERLLAPALVLLLAAWSGGRLLDAPWVGLAGVALAACLAGFAGLTLYLLQQRKRPGADATTLYWRLSMASMLACCALYLVPDALARPWVALMGGALFIAGFAMSAVNGMLCKIVPFLLWYHLAQQGLPRSAVPGAQKWISDRDARIQFWLHASALLLLCAATVAPALARPAGALLACACGAMAVLLARPALRYRRLRASAVEPA